MSVKSLLIPAVCVALVILFAGWDSRVSTQASTNQAQPGANARSATARMEAAKAVYDGYKARMKAELGPIDRRGAGHELEFLCEWSVRWLDAERAIDKAKAKQVAACSSHLDRVKSHETMCEGLVKEGHALKYELAMMQYFRIEAEQWLAEAKGQ